MSKATKGSLMDVALVLLLVALGFCLGLAL